MVNKFTFKSDDAFDLNLNPLFISDAVTGRVDWGDGTVTEYVYGANSHSYASGGEYTVTFTTENGSEIGNGFCASNNYLTSVELDDGITRIGAGTFYYAKNLTRLDVPGGAFVEDSSCTGSGLKMVHFGRYRKGSVISLTSCGTQAFMDCTNLESITFYTSDATLQGTTVSDYFILNGSEGTYIPVEYIATHIPSVITSIPESNYITVYDMCETDFSHNGLRILSPLSCSITEQLNGEYSLTLEHPIDPAGAWRFLVEFNIIKAQGQLFRIYKKTTKLNSSGLATRTVYAQHIWYDLSHKLIKECDISGMAGQQALDTIMASVFDDDIDGAYHMYDFSRYSDITSVANNETVYKLTSPVACFIGEDNCIINRLGGQLYRDNFYFSICQTKEHSQSNAFNIVHGINMLDIEEVVDYSDFCTYLYTEDNYGNEYSVAYVPNNRFPHNFAQGKTFNYNENNIESLRQDMTTYFEERWTPKITYTVSFASLKNAILYKDFINLANFQVGDSGTIYSEELEINTTQTIVSKTIDALTGDTTSITLGNFPRSLTRKERYSNTITRTDNLISRVTSPYRGVNVNGEAALQALAGQGKLSPCAVYYDISGQG